MADIISLQDGERPSQSQPTQTSPVIDWVPCIWSFSFSVVMVFYSWLCHSFFIWSFAFLYKDVLSVFFRLYGWMMIELVIKFQVYLVFFSYCCDGFLVLVVWLASYWSFASLYMMFTVIASLSVVVFMNGWMVMLRVLQFNIF